MSSQVFDTFLFSLFFFLKLFFRLENCNSRIFCVTSRRVTTDAGRAVRDATDAASILNQLSLTPTCLADVIETETSTILALTGKPVKLVSLCVPVFVFRIFRIFVTHFFALWIINLRLAEN